MKRIFPRPSAAPQDGSTGQPGLECRAAARRGVGNSGMAIHLAPGAAEKCATRTEQATIRGAAAAELEHVRRPPGRAGVHPAEPERAVEDPGDPVGGDPSERALPALARRGRFLAANGTIPKMPLDLASRSSTSSCNGRVRVARDGSTARARRGSADVARWTYPPEHPSHLPARSREQALEDIASRRVMGKAIVVPS